VAKKLYPNKQGGQKYQMFCATSDVLKRISASLLCKIKLGFWETRITKRYFQQNTWNPVWWINIFHALVSVGGHWNIAVTFYAAISKQCIRQFDATLPPSCVF